MAMGTNSTSTLMSINALLHPHCNPLQGQYRVEFTTQGKPCFHYREPLFSLQGPCIHHRESCIHYREFPVRITTQGNPCNHYREWVCSARDLYNMTLDAAEMPFGLAEVLFLLYLGNAWFGVAKYVPWPVHLCAHRHDCNILIRQLL